MGVLNVLTTVIDKVFPDKDKANDVKVTLAEMHNSGELKKIGLRYGVISDEAKSQHKFVALALSIFLIHFLFFVGVFSCHCSCNWYF